MMRFGGEEKKREKKKEVSYGWSGVRAGGVKVRSRMMRKNDRRGSRKSSRWKRCEVSVL